MTERLVRFPGSSWQEIEALPQPLRWTVQRTIFHLLDEPIPTLAERFPHDDPLDGAYELHLPSHDVTIRYTLTEHQGREVISVQLLDSVHARLAMAKIPSGIFVPTQPTQRLDHDECCGQWSGDLRGASTLMRTWPGVVVAQAAEPAGAAPMAE